MKKCKWIFNMMVVAVVLMLQSCNKDDGYSIGDFSWDWATVRTTGSGSYYLEGDRWGTIEPVASAIPWFKPVDGERVVSFFNPLADLDNTKGVQVKMEGIHQVLTKEVEEMTDENEAEFGNDPIMIYQGDMWLGGKFLNIIFCQKLPSKEKHRISLVKNKIATDNPGTEEDTDNTSSIDKEGYVHLELRYNTYDDVTNNLGWGKVSYNLEPFYPTEVETNETELKGFKITINSKKNGEGVVRLDLSHPVGVPEKAQEIHTASEIR